MVTRIVTIFTCDICRATDEGVGGHPKFNEDPLPKDWVKVIGNSNDKNILDLDLCTNCIKAIKDAVEESHEISALTLSSP